jgi:hypothetical protein
METGHELHLYSASCHLRFSVPSPGQTCLSLVRRSRGIAKQLWLTSTRNARLIANHRSSKCHIFHQDEVKFDDRSELIGVPFVGVQSCKRFLGP